MPIDSVDPKLFTHINNLVSALGGYDTVKEVYVLGDDAVACLRDIKRWLKGYDAHLGKWDVARAISDTTLVSDIIQILDLYNGNPDSIKLRVIALACLELLVPLTWPLVVDEESSESQFAAFEALKAAQIKYKSLLLLESSTTLTAILKIANEPLMTILEDKRERSARDDDIIKLTVLLFRNIAAIGDDEHVPAISAEYISRNQVLGEYSRQHVLDFIIALTSEIGHSLREQDTALLECIFYLLNGIKPQHLYSKSSTKKSGNISENTDAQDLSNALKYEKVLSRNVKNQMSTRHSRFGPLVTVQMPGTPGHGPVTAQAIKGTATDYLELVDKRKKWRKPKHISKKSLEKFDFEKIVTISQESKAIVKDFAVEFLSVSFNALMDSIRKLIEREADRLLRVHSIYYLYIGAWFLEFHRIQTVTNNVVDYSLVANALSQNHFVIMTRMLIEPQDPQAMDLDTVHAAMICFREVIETIVDMERRGTPLDIEMSDNMKDRIFYQEYTLEGIAKLPRMTVTRSYGFLKDTVHFVHVILKALEKYSQKESVFVARKQKRRNKSRRDTSENNDLGSQDEEEDGYDEERSQAERAREIKFEFARFEQKFVHDATISTFKLFLDNYPELDEREIMWAIKFFHRLFFKNEQRVHFYSIDLILLFRNMISNNKGLSLGHRARKPVQKFVAKYTAKLIEALERTPCLFMELAFNKMSNTIHYFEYGEVLQKKVSRKAKTIELDFKDTTIDNERKIALIVAAMVDADQVLLVEWVAGNLAEMIENRLRWINIHKADASTEPPLQYLTISSNADDYLAELSNNGKLRLLLRLCHMTLPDAGKKGQCSLKGNVDIADMQQCHLWINKYLKETVQVEEGKQARDYLVTWKDLDQTGEEDDNENAIGRGYGEGDGFVVDDDDEEDDDPDKAFNDKRLARSTNLSAEELEAKRLVKKRDAERRREMRAEHGANAQKSKRRKRTVINDSGSEGSEDESPSLPPIESRDKTFISAAFVEDSDDEDEEFMQKYAEFFAKEKNMLDEREGKQMLMDRFALAAALPDAVRDVASDVDDVLSPGALDEWPNGTPGDSADILLDAVSLNVGE